LRLPDGERILVRSASRPAHQRSRRKRHDRRTHHRDSSVSKKGFEDAISEGILRANKTLRKVKGAWVKDMEVNVEDGKITGYKVISRSRS